MKLPTWTEIKAQHKKNLVLVCLIGITIGTAVSYAVQQLAGGCK